MITIRDEWIPISVFLVLKIVSISSDVNNFLDATVESLNTQRL